MDKKLCRICGKLDENHVFIFKTEGLKNKIETCLPIVINEQSLLPDTICNCCRESVDNFYSFIKNCLQNIIVLEAQYEIIESCLKTKRKKDKSVSVCDSDFEPATEMNELNLSVKVNTPIPNFALVDYDFSDSNSAQDEIKTDQSEKNTQNNSDIIMEIKQRKYLKRKIDTILPITPKNPRFEHETSSRRKNKQPKKLLHTKLEPPQVEEPQVFTETLLPPPESLQTCLLCEQQFYGPVLLSAHMFETHGIDLAQVLAPTQPSQSAKKKIPELVKISDITATKKQPQPLDNFDEPPVLLPEISPPSPEPTFSTYKNLTCNECSNGVIYTSFKEFSSHRRSQHQIFHCDLCLKYYGRNSHLWKHVNRVHKGHPSITCRLCNKTSASKYHLSQHFTKMHSIKTKVETPPTLISEEDDFIKQKFEAFDFQSVRQSFLIQDILEKKKKEEAKNEKPVEKRRNFDISDIKTIPKEIDSSSNLYTNIITNYTPPANEGAYKCPKCFKSFYKKNLLKKHKKNCRPRLQKDLLTRCKTCSRIFKDRQSLTKHLINYHSEYTCEICSVAVQSKCEIVSHIRFSHPDSELVCYCGQILRSKNDLLKHKMDHKDTHVCQFCGDLLPTKIKLKMHILSLHRKILSLSCGICLKLFETQQILRDHVRLSHFEQLSPLTSCTVCGKNYGSKWKTFDHLNKSHGRIFKACKTCLEVFETEQELEKHFEKEHLNQKQEKSKPIEVKKVDNFKKENESFIEDFGSSLSDEDELDSEQLQEDMNYRNYIMKEFQSNLEIKNSEYPNFTEQGVSLLEKRLLGNEPKKKYKKSKIYQNGKEKKQKLDRYDPTENSSKRTVYVNSNDPSLCEICLKVWPAKKHLWQHYIRCHKQTAATVCGICLKTSPDYTSLQKHLRETHPTLLHGCGFGSNFICKICGRYHNASSKLKLHMAIHVGYQNEAETYNMPENGFDEVKEEIKQEINYDQMIEEVEYSDDEEDLNDTYDQKFYTDTKDESPYVNFDDEFRIKNSNNDLKFKISKLKKVEQGNDINKEEVEEVSDSESDLDEDDKNEQIDLEENGVEYDNESEISKESESDESSDVEQDLEKEMLKNMLGENVMKPNLIINDSSVESLKNESFNWGDSSKQLDSAICSISYEGIDALGDNELDVAVDSIL